MTKKTYIASLFSALVILMGLTSCEDFFIKDLEVPRQDLDNQVVVHAFISDIDTSIEFKIARNFGLDEISDEPESLIDNANIIIYEGDNPIHEISQNEDGRYKLDLEGKFGSGDNYRVEVEHPDYETAFVETNMPSFVMPESITFKKDGGFADPSGEDDLDLMQITFSDPADEVNYYEFQVHQILIDSEEIIFGQDTFITETRYPDSYFTPDGNFEQGVSGFVLSDQLINGQTYTIQIMMNSNQPLDTIPVEKLRVSWNCISKDHYEFVKTLQRYQTSVNFGLFSDPIAIYSNVQNGLGAVTFRTSRVLEVEQQ
jgi:hypothetical protein